MLIDVIQNPSYVQASYTNDHGGISIENLKLPPEGYSNWDICDEDDDLKDNTFRNHDGQPVKRVSGREFYDLNLHEFLTKRIDKELRDKIFGFYKPDFFSVDIETEITDDAMPDADSAPNTILSISITAPNLATIILSLKDCDMDVTMRIVNEYLSEYAEKNKVSFPTKHFTFDSEKEMLVFFLENVKKRFHLHGGWNYIGYDWKYITNRCIKNNISLEICSPIGKIDNGIPVHRLVIDYMQAYKDGSRGNSALLSYSLNAVAEYELDLQKLDYDKTLKELYRDDYNRFIAYAIIDTILVQLIHIKTNKIDQLFNMAYYTKLQFKRSDGNIAQTDSLQFEEFYATNRVYADRRQKIEERNYEGAFVKEPVYHECDFPAAVDAKSLYPSIMRTYNLSPELYIGKCKKEEVSSLRKKGLTVTDSLSVYKNPKEGGSFKKLQEKLATERGLFKTSMLYIYDELTVKIEEEAKRRGIKLKSDH